MRIIHGKGYTDKDRAEFAGLVYRNIVLAVQILSEAMVNLSIQYDREENRVSYKHQYWGPYTVLIRGFQFHIHVHCLQY